NMNNAGFAIMDFDANDDFQMSLENLIVPVENYKALQTSQNPSFEKYFPGEEVSFSLQPQFLGEQKLSGGRVGLSEFYLQHVESRCAGCGVFYYKLHRREDYRAVTNKFNQWTLREKIFLTGCVMSIY